MTVESATYISGLNATLPTGADAKAEGDDHIRLLKSTILASFPGITGAMTGTHTQLNKLVSTFSIASASAGAVTVDASGNVGLSVGAPGYRLEALGTVASTTASGGVPAFRLNQSGVAAWSIKNLASTGTLIVYDEAQALERMRFDFDGNIVSNVTALAPALSSNRTMVFSLPSDTQLRISVRGSDGVTRTANLTLS